MIACIEIPAGSSIKYEWNEDWQTLEVARFLDTAMTPPHAYGGLVGTQSEDGQMMDVFVFSSLALRAGVFVPCRLIAQMLFVDEGVPDPKGIAVVDSLVSPYYDHWLTPQDIPLFEIDRLVHFVLQQKQLSRPQAFTYHGIVAPDGLESSISPSNIPIPRPYRGP